MIHSEAWSACASLVNVAPYAKACVQDMCGCGNTTDDFCICSTLAEFSRQSKECPFNMVYEESGSPCMNTCTLSDTSSLCEDHKMDGCFCPAVEEGSHVTTFDGKAFKFHGDCHYILAKTMTSVQILAFSADGKVRHNMQIISLPYHTGDINIFQASSFHILLQTRFGLQIQVQHVPVLQVYLTLDQSYKTKTRGLCGNYNMVLADDMKTPQGIVEGTASSFGNSWKTSPTCPDREERLENPCSLSVETGMPRWFIRCMYATCNCEKTEACMCAVFSSYSRACASKGVILEDWRVNRCQWTCKQLNSEQQSCTSDFLPVDGCSCAEGMYLDDKGVCVPMAKCPCYHSGVHIKSGKSISIRDQH
ncbi:hypothetical protein CRUP_020556, partial [Coryphaenoides rupestris]